MHLQSRKFSATGSKVAREHLVGGLQNDPAALRAFMTAEPARAASAIRFDDALDRMTMPVLLISGDNDERYAGSRARKAAGELPDGHYIEVPDADHFMLYVRGDLVVPHVLEFLTKQHSRPVPT